MSTDFDVIIIGSGPAGVSAAYPLVQSGVKVLMVDGQNGITEKLEPISKPYLTERKSDENQWKWILGSKFYSIGQKSNVSPKLRVPAYDYVFKDFLEKNKINVKNFVAIGSLAKGGLSNAWGCGVARMSEKEMHSFPFSLSDIEKSYEFVTRRIGVSGSYSDDLSDYFGLDRWSQPPIDMDHLHTSLLKNYLKQRVKLNLSEFKLGRSRVAALSRKLDDRNACDLSGNCLWGCHQDSLYSASKEIDSLLKFSNFKYKSGFIVDAIIKTDSSVEINGEFDFLQKKITAKKIFLAAGTLATTRLALNALKFSSEVQLQSAPTAAFLLWLPRMISSSSSNSNGFGLGQLSFTCRLNEEISAFGSTFSTSGLPVSEFVRYMPFGKRFGIDFLRIFLNSCLVGNVFLPGSLSTATVSVNKDGVMNILGGADNNVDSLMSNVEKILRKNYLKMGAVLIPGSFNLGSPGSGIHYSSTLPMRVNPKIGETNFIGELKGLDSIYVVDGASLSNLSEKSHTLTIMANADRIGRIVASHFQEKNNIAKK